MENNSYISTVRLRDMKTTNEKSKRDSRLKGMIKSLFTYGGLYKDNTYLDSYRLEYEDENEYNKKFDEYAKYYREKYEVRYNTYTDHEGCTYNSLVEK